MLNWIWAGLIVLSFGFAMWTDVGEMAGDRYRNGDALPVVFEPVDEGEAAAVSLPEVLTNRGEERSLDAFAVIDAQAFGDFYGVDPLPETLRVAVTLTSNRDGVDAKLTAPEAGWPEPLATILPFSQSRDERLLASVDPSPAGDAQGVGLVFEPVQFRKLTDIAQAAFDMADTAFEIALGLTGVLCLWLGLVKIAEDAGLVLALVKVVRPLLGLIFPEIPKDHPALGMIALNLAANMLGLGNAATPMGLKAMDELQKLNETEDTATNSMCMFLAVNTASVQLVPPATLVAIMGVSTGQLWLPILIVTGLSLLIAILAARALSLAPVFAKSDPERLKQAKTLPGRSGDSGAEGRDDA
ncbi:MAG: nucleoside recognition domain-containing protein [Planctomycetota bacterium]